MEDYKRKEKEDEKREDEKGEIGREGSLGGI